MPTGVQGAAFLPYCRGMWMPVIRVQGIACDDIFIIQHLHTAKTSTL